MVLLVVLLGCVNEDQTSGAERLSRLESEVKALKAEARANDQALRDELALIRKNLEAMRVLMEAGEAPVPPESPSEDLGEGIKEKARAFVEENLDRLMGLTKELLDQMEQELDQRMEQQELPSAESGDET